MSRVAAKNFIILGVRKRKVRSFHMHSTIASNITCKGCRNHFFFIKTANIVKTIPVTCNS